MAEGRQALRSVFLLNEKMLLSAPVCKLVPKWLPCGQSDWQACRDIAILFNVAAARWLSVKLSYPTVTCGQTCGQQVSDEQEQQPSFSPAAVNIRRYMISSYAKNPPQNPKYWKMLFGMPSMWTKDFFYSLWDLAMGWYLPAALEFEAWSISLLNTAT